jgi:hypothetical protein
MARKKVNLELIPNDAARRATFRKRSANLLKKASELATLCDVDMCVVVFGEGSPEPLTWPPSATEAAHVLYRFKAMPEVAQSKKMLDMKGYLQQQVDKLKGQVEKACRDNNARETKLLLHDAMAGRHPSLEGLSRNELASLFVTVEARLQEVRKTIQHRKEQGYGDPATVLQLSSMASHAPPPEPYTACAGNSEAVHAPNPKGSWLLDVTKAEGFGGEVGSFGGGVNNLLDVNKVGGFGAGSASTSSGGLGDMLQLGSSMTAGLPWADQEPSFPPPM